MIVGVMSSENHINEHLSTTISELECLQDKTDTLSKALPKFPHRPTILLVRIQSLLTGLLPLCPWPRTPCQHPRAISPCCSNTASGPLSSSLEPCPAWPRPCQARSLSPGMWLMLKAGAAPELPGCPASGWRGGTGPGYLAQPSPLWGPPSIWPQGAATSSSALVQ